MNRPGKVGCVGVADWSLSEKALTRPLAIWSSWAWYCGASVSRTSARPAKAPERIAIGADAPVIGVPSTVTALPLDPATSVGVGVKETVRAAPWNSGTPLSV